MYKETKGTVFIIKPIWWIKINTKALRKGTLDGSRFPHVIKVKYDVDGQEYICKKWLSIYDEVPKMNQVVKVFYEQDNPQNAKIKL